MPATKTTIGVIAAVMLLAACEPDHSYESIDSRDAELLPEPTGTSAGGGSASEQPAESLEPIDVETDDAMEAPDDLASDPAEANASPGASADYPLLDDVDPLADGSCGFSSNAVAISGCVWEKATTTSSSSVRVDCDDAALGRAAVLGGCFTDSAAELKFSTPDEGSIGDMPDDGTVFTHGTADGWSCGYDASPGAGQAHRALALCCFQFHAAYCS